MALDCWCSICAHPVLYHRQQKKWYLKWMISKNDKNCIKFDRSNKFDFCYYGQVNSLRLNSSVA